MKKREESYEIIMQDTRFTAEISEIPGSSNMKVTVRHKGNWATKVVPNGDMAAAQAASESLRRSILKNVRR